MDPVSLAYYGLICGALAATAPRLPSGFLRVLVGILVGLVAAGALPSNCAALGA
jgi:hypothetical protein